MLTIFFSVYVYICLQGYLYLSSWTRSKIYRIHEDNVTDRVDLTTTLANFPMGVKVFKKETQFKGILCGDKSTLIVSHISKILEKIINDQLMAYLSDNHILTPYQSGFVSKHSTTTALLKVVNDVLTSLNEGSVTIACTLDIRKCFDSVQHDILLSKMQNYGICGNELDWFSSFLSGRKQAVSCNNNLSSFLEVKYGVPQGSSLGPTLCLLHLNSLPSVISDNAVVNLFADDALVYSFGHNIPELVLNIQNELNTVTNWMTLNKLKINVEKSSFIMFGSRHKITTNSTDEIALCINDEKLKYTPTLKYLGITLDETLSWGPHVDNICKKTGQRNGMLCRLMSVLPTESLNVIYKTLILPLFDYAMPVWG